MNKLYVVIVCVVCCMVGTLATPQTLQVHVDGVTRTALVYPGQHATNAVAPVIVAFHGYNGSARQFAAIAQLQNYWPEATVVYPQGINIRLPQLREDGRGWQYQPGLYGDRDIRMVEVMLTELSRTMGVDRSRIFVTGMSNGAMFADVLFATRPHLFAGFASVAGTAGAFLHNATVPRPMLIIHGSADPLIPMRLAAATRDTIRRINGCGTQEVVWTPGYVSYQPCTSNMPLIWHAHPGGHIWPRDASPMIARFFQGL